MDFGGGGQVIRVGVSSFPICAVDLLPSTVVEGSVLCVHEQGIDDRRLGMGWGPTSPSFLPFLSQFAIGSLMDDYLGECLTWVLGPFPGERMCWRGDGCRI